MDTDKFNKYIAERYNPQIGWYDRKSMYNQKLYKRLQFLLIVFSSLTPILIIIEKLEQLQAISWLYWVPTSTAVMVAILASVIKTYRFQENWINYRTTCETLRKEYYYYEANLDEYKAAEDTESLFVERVESLISRENTMWLSTQKSEKPKSQDS